MIKWVDDGSPCKSSPVYDDQGETLPKKQKKRRVIEAKIEPPHSVIPGLSLELDLIFSANCNYAKYTCKTDRIYFKDTFIFQTRLFRYCHFMGNNLTYVCLI